MSLATDIPAFWWTLIIGTSAFLSLVIGLIALILYGQKRFIAAQQEKISILQVGKERFSKLVEGTPVPTLVSVNGIINYINPAVLTLMNTREVNEILGKSLVDFIRFDSTGINKQTLKETLKSYQPLPTTELVLIRMDGEILETQVAAIPVTLNEEQIELIVIHDITETNRAKREMEELPNRLLEVQEEERKQFAREMHDGVNQTLFHAKGKIETYIRKHASQDMPNTDILSSALDTVITAMKEIRNISHRLRPPVLDDFGLASAINTMADNFATETQINVIVKGFEFNGMRLASNIELAVFRGIQQALNNIQKHSGATEARIECSEEETSYKITITDNGKGIESDRLSSVTHSSGVGLISMRERAKNAGGTFAISSTPGKGTTVSLTVPKVYQTQTAPAK